MAKVLKKPTPVSKKMGGMTAPDGMVVLFTIVDKRKGDFYADLIQGFEVNLQTILSGQGTADREALSLLGLHESEKAVIISMVRRDRINEVLSMLEYKFRTVKGGKGIAYTVPMSSTIGVLLYQFMSNRKGGTLG